MVLTARVCGVGFTVGVLCAGIAMWGWPTYPSVVERLRTAACPRNDGRSGARSLRTPKTQSHRSWPISEGPTVRPAAACSCSLALMQLGRAPMRLASWSGEVCCGSKSARTHVEQTSPLCSGKRTSKHTAAKSAKGQKRSSQNRGFSVDQPVCERR